jgi:hypothetical protein
MRSRMSPSEVRRRILSEWHSWADQILSPTEPHTRIHADQFCHFLETDRAAMLTSLGITKLNEAEIHGWLFRNGEVID